MAEEDSIPFALDEEKDSIKDKSLYCCYHCIYCPLNSEEQIISDGTWQCYRTKKWHSGNEVFVKDCKMFRFKSCKSCRDATRCETEWLFEHGALTKKVKNYNWCRDFKSKYIREPDLLFVGRRIRYQGRNQIVRIREQNFWDRIEADMRLLKQIEADLEKNTQRRSK